VSLHAHYRGHDVGGVLAPGIVVGAVVDEVGMRPLRVGPFTHAIRQEEFRPAVRVAVEQTRILSRTAGFPTVATTSRPGRNSTRRSRPASSRKIDWLG